MKNVMQFNILVVDDEDDIREIVSGILTDNGYKAKIARGYIDALSLIQKQRIDLIILDVWLGDNDKDSQRLLELVVNEFSYIPVIMMSGHGTVDTAISAIKQGAYDFIEKPFDSNRLITSIEKALEAYRLKIENDELRVKAKISNAIVGKSANVIYIRKAVEQIGPLGGRCIIVGPNGADKEIIAREIHRLSPRAKKSFLHISCEAYGVRQLESELFGMEIMTSGNTQVKQGMLEKVNGGTLFIEGLSTTSQEFQSKFLKVLKEDSFSRIGSIEKISANIRVIAGFSNEIEQQVRERKFNTELFCRLNANIIKVSPLKNRREDIPLLLDHFMNQSSKVYNVLPKKFSNAAFEVLNSYLWPGDVCQLRNVIDWVLTSSSLNEDSKIISIDNLPQDILNSKTGRFEVPFASSVSELSIREAKIAFEREYFIEQLRKFSGSVSKTAKFVGMDRTALHRKLKSLKIGGIKSDINEDL
ncbi:MAG: sigma-54 dependent transcriptional regulator [Holosporales bacterium]|jgi:two-component system nitrogen regulation response regulator NtrX|nr:sigma-54 dependent transcriptional regulator [Holosporales bacterium]